MPTLIVNVRGSFMQDLLAISEDYNDKIQLKKDEYGLISFDDFEQKTNQLEKEFELKYAKIK